MPKLKHTGNQAADAQQRMVRECLQQLLVAFSEKPELVIATIANLQTGMITTLEGAPKEDEASAKMWDRSHKTLKKMPKYYMGQVLVNLAGDEKKLNKTILNEMDNKASDNIRLLFDLVLQTVPSSAWPLGALGANVCHSMLAGLAKQVGNRLDIFLASKALNPNTGAVAWERCGAYEVKRAAGQIKEVKHIMGDVGKVPAHLVLDATWGFRDPTYDMQARFVKGQTVVHCWEMFAERKGPRQWAINDKQEGDDQLAQIVDRLCKKKTEAAVEANRLASNALVADESFLDESCKEKREQALKRAREKVAANNLETRRRKSLRLSAPSEAKDEDKKRLRCEGSQARIVA